MIGDLYDANNIIVGQAAVLVAPNGTALPSFLGLSMTDPFSSTAWTSQTLTVAATSTYTLTDANGNVTSSLATASTISQVQAALDALTPNDSQYTVSGGSSPYTITQSGDAGPLTVQTLTGTVSLTPALWVPLGATDQGWKYSTAKTVVDQNIEEQSTPVSQAITTQKVTLEGSLSEDITRTLALAYNGLVTQVAAGSSTPGYDLISLTDTVLYYAVALITLTVTGKPRIIYAPKWSQLTNTDTSFRRAAAKRMYPVSFETLCKPSQIQVYNFTASHT